MSHLYELESFVMHLIPKDRSICVLDVGCGKGMWGYFLRALRNNVAYLCGLDITAAYVRFVAKRSVYDDVILCDCSHMPFKDRSFDVALLSEVLEHLSKSRGYAVLRQLERIAGELVIVAVPQGYVRQEAVDGIAAEKHVSAWYANEFTSLGFQVMGVGNRLFKYYLAERHPRLWGAAHYISTPIANILPQIAGYLVCYKELH
jgi:ubiquinone/menaquinone biosynthesis C-methylase UbiE